MPLLKQIVRFCLGGGVGVILYYATLYSLTEWAGVWYIASGIIAWVVNWGTNFTIQKFWTFRNMDREAARRQGIQYFSMAIGFLVVGTPLIYALVEWVGLQYLVAQVMITVVFSAASYLISRRIFASAT
jgi:dolichol-phosphate mannosyltransferase